MSDSVAGFFAAQVMALRAGMDLGTGLLHAIRRDFEDCLGKDWWKK